MKSLSILFASALCTLTCFAQNKTDSIKAAAIFNKSKDAYAHLKTYVDMGSAVTNNSNSHSSQEIIFKTAYDGAGFNFDCYTSGKPNSFYTLNRTGNTIKSWWGITGKETTASNILSALSSANGTSASAAYIIPRFLFPADFNNINYYTPLKSIKIVGNEKVNGQDCIEIKGQLKYGSAMIWVSRQDYMIRKIETETKMDPARTEASLRQAIAIGKARRLDYSGIEKALKTYHEIGVRDSLRGHPRLPYISRETFLFSPTANGKVNAELLKYRPDRTAG